ncbi:zinc finger MYM-type protein 1 [Trichonephila clavipes]|nr:zinc finger MYM-type protein 1 [Trichonephila clavipes]
MWLSSKCSGKQNNCSTGLTLTLSLVDTKKKSVLDKQLQEQLRKDTKFYHDVLKRVIAAVKYLAIIGLAFRGTEEVFGSPHNVNFMGALKLLDEFDPFICELIEQR